MKVPKWVQKIILLCTLSVPLEFKYDQPVEKTTTVKGVPRSASIRIACSVRLPVIDDALHAGSVGFVRHAVAADMRQRRQRAACQPPTPGALLAPPSHGAALDALRPACPSWIASLIGEWLQIALITMPARQQGRPIRGRGPFERYAIPEQRRSFRTSGCRRSTALSGKGGSSASRWPTPRWPCTGAMAQ